jgi:hypothetical protein
MHLANPVANENEIALFINFVRQEPTTAYTASGTSLTLTSATSATDDMYAIFLGKAVQTVNPPAGSVGLDKIDSTAKSFLTRNYRNIIINGDMSIAQRATSVSNVNSGYYTVDRFLISTTSGSFDMAQSSDVPTGQGFVTSLKLDCNTTHSFTSSQEAFFQQRIEAQNLNRLKFGSANAENFTISFWVKSNKTGNYSVWLYSPDTTNNASLQYTINSANTWEKKVLNFVGDTSSSIANDNGIGLEVRFYLAAGANIQGTPTATWSTDYTNRYPTGGVNFLDSTANDWYITGVQLEAGTTASDFEFLPVDVNLQRCQRYFQSIGGVDSSGIANGMCQQTAASRLTLHYITTMRAAPTHSVNDLKISDAYSFSLDVTSISATFANNSSSSFNVLNASGGTSGRPIVLSPKSTASTSRLTLEAEL